MFVYIDVTSRLVPDLILNRHCFGTSILDERFGYLIFQYDTLLKQKRIDTSLVIIFVNSDNRIFRSHILSTTLIISTNLIRSPI